MSRFTGFIGPSYTLGSVNVDCQRCVNLYPELNEVGTGKEQEIASLVGTPGLETLVTLGAGPIRGMWRASNGRSFVVSGTKLYELDDEFEETERGTLTSLTGEVSMADNGIQLVIVDGLDGYYLTFATDVFTEITDENFQGANQVVYSDGYFVFNKPDSDYFYIADLNSITFLGEEKQLEGSPDLLIGIAAYKQNLWFFGHDSTEIYYNSGNADFPFERVQGAFVEKGIAARFSIAQTADSIFWLGQDKSGYGTVYVAEGYQPIRISTHAVETAIRTYSDISDARAYTYQDVGHTFYVLNFPTANTTWVYDLSTKLWHERSYTNQGTVERHRANCHMYTFGKHVVGDYANGKVYEMALTLYSDAGDEIKRMRTAPHITSGLKNVFHEMFQLDIESGVGLDGVGQGTDPKVILEYSDDGGHSWSNEKWRSMGKIGQTKRRAIWRRLGLARDRVYRVTIADPVKVVLIGAELQLAQGGS